MNSIQKNERVLVVAAHPDDEVLGCGGTIAMLASMGKEIYVLVLGGVTTSRYKEKQDEEFWKGEAFKDETRRATAVLDSVFLKKFGFLDNRFDTIPLLDIIKVVENVKSEVEPDLILTHDYADLNVDHKLTHQAVITAFRPDIKYNRFRIMTFEILSSTEWQDQNMITFHPNCYVDITEYIHKKIEAMRCYQSELKKYPHPRSIDGIEYLARKRGMEVCLQYAEAFRIVREVW